MIVSLTIVFGLAIVGAVSIVLWVTDASIWLARRRMFRKLRRDARRRAKLPLAYVRLQPPVSADDELARRRAARIELTKRLSNRTVKR